MLAGTGTDAMSCPVKSQFISHMALYAPYFQEIEETIENKKAIVVIIAMLVILENFIVLGSTRDESRKLNYEKYFWRKYQHVTG
jgi:hypothetical protein